MRCCALKTLWTQDDTDISSRGLCGPVQLAYSPRSDHRRRPRRIARASLAGRARFGETPARPQPERSHTAMNKQRLFTASCIALIATAMSFAIRGDIMGDFETIFHLNKTNVGWIAGAAFWGFGLSIFIGGPLCDVLGMGTIMRLAAAGHIGGTVLTLVAPNFAVLFLATVIIGIANGLVEAAINPLISTLYSDQKVKRLTALHAWFPGGIVIGGVLCFLFSQVGLGWQAKMLLMLIPSAIYTFLFVGQQFPP